MDIQELIRDRESERLDSKQVHHEDTLSLLHDILCMTDAWTELDRVLVFGVSGAKAVVGVEADVNRRRGAEIQDLLRASRLNRIPTVWLELFRIDGHDVDVLTIKNRPDKPFSATADKVYRVKHYPPASSTPEWASPTSHWASQPPKLQRSSPGVSLQPIAKPNPPEPDVLCKVGEPREPVAFELVEIIDEGWARTFGPMWRPAPGTPE